MVVGGGGLKSFSCLTQLKVMLGWVELWLSWGFDNLLKRRLVYTVRQAKMTRNQAISSHSGS